MQWKKKKKEKYIMVLSREIKRGVDHIGANYLETRSRVDRGHGEVLISISRPIGRSMERAKPRRNEEETFGGRSVERMLVDLEKIVF